MGDETIRTDVSEASKGPQDDQTTDTTNQGGEQGGEQQEAPKPVLNDPVSRRERRMAELSESARQERERNRKSAALMNDPDITEEEYDAKLEAIRTDSAAVKDSERQALEEHEHKGGDDDDPAAAQGHKASAQGEEGQGEQAQRPSPRPGWDLNDQGQLVKKLKVNGRVVELTEKQYDEQLAKDLAGDEKLRRANEKERQLEQELERRDRGLREQHQPPSGADDEAFEAALSEYHEAVYAGDTDKAKEKLREIARAGRQSSTPNIDDLRSSISRQVRDDIEQEQQEKDVQKGWSAFQEEYSEIASHEKRLAYADIHLKEVQAEHPEYSPADMFMEAGRRTAEELGLAKKKTAGDDTARERLNRKQHLSSVPRSNSARAPVEERPKVDNSPEGKIARMRAARAVN